MTLRLALALAALLALAGPAAAADPTVATPGKTGALLLYHLVSSGDPFALPDDDERDITFDDEDTRLTLTNSSASEPAAVRLFFVAASGTVASSTVCLTPRQTASFRASSLRPDVRGYVVALAVDHLGCPTGLNVLTGQAHVWLASGFRGSLDAVAAAAQFAGTLPGCDANSVTAMVFFTGAAGGYDAMPGVLHLVDLPSPADQRTLLVLNRIGGNLAIGASTLGSLYLVLRDDAGTAHGLSATGSSQLALELSEQFLATAPIPAGHTGWLRLENQSAAIALAGVALFAAPAPEPLEPPTNAREPLPVDDPPPPSPFATGAVTLTPSRLTVGGAYAVPVFSPGC